MKKALHNRSRALPLYEQIADQIHSLIDEGTFKPGERVPSIRNLSRQMSISVNTVKEAYACLEDQRVIEARPQSGYYVSPRLPDIPAEPRFEKGEFNASEIGNNDLIFQVIKNTLNPNLIQFGAAVPNFNLLPTTKLNRMFYSAAKKSPGSTAICSIPPGYEPLRNQIVKRVIQAGCVLHPDEIVITNGGTEAVHLALRATCKPGDTVIVESPTYFSFLQMIQEMGLKVLEIPVSCTEGISLDALSYVLETTSVQACLVITNFNNPVGVSVSEENKKRLVELLDRYDVPLIEDDVNGDLSYKDCRPFVAKQHDTRGTVLLCSSFSKTIAPGYRIGWIAPGRYKSKVERSKLITNLASASPLQMALAEFLANGGYDRHLRGARRAYAKKTALMAEAVYRDFPAGTRISRPKGGTTLWVELPTYVDTVELYNQALENGITIAPGTIFSTTKKFSHFIRLNASFWLEENEWAVNTLGRIAKCLKP